MLLYNLFIHLYAAATRLFSLWNPKAKRWVNGRKEFPSLPASFDPAAKKIWFHCASLGEYEQARPLLEKTKQAYPSHKIILSFFSPSGYEVVKKQDTFDAIYYLPIDTRANAERFIDAIGPSLVIWVKYEYWFHYLTGLKKRKIPVLLVSGIFRPNQPFFKWYGNIWKQMLQCFDHLFLQTADAAALLASIGIKENVSISGDTRFDRVTDIANNAAPLPALISEFCNNHPVIVAGSTWEEDEDEMDHYANTHPAVKFIIAPHETDEGHLKDIQKKFRHTILFSELTAGKEISADTNCLVIDNVGMLSRLYQYASIAYIGGGFGADGVHNVLEAAVWGKPVIFGPEYSKYIEAVELVECGGAISIENALELEKILDGLINDQGSLQKAGRQAKDYVYSKGGATSAIMDFIQAKRLLMS